MAAPQNVVHQINFGLQPEGISVLGGTMSTGDMLVWLRRLQAHLRLQRFGSALPPERALSTFEFPDGWTAVVRRWSSGGTIGRNDAMALIARSSWLPLPVVLGLDQRFDWDTAAGQRPFQKWNAEQLQALGEAGTNDLRASAQQLPDLLRRTLGRLFDAPEQPLTIVGCPAEQRVPLLWGLNKLAAARLFQQYGRRLSTFSTYEVEDADSIAHLPTIVFLPDRPVGPTVSRRVLVDVRVDANVSSASAELARRRVEAFLDDREVELVGVEAAGEGIRTPRHAASLSLGRPGVFHGSLSYLLQDADGQVSPAHSVSAGLDYPGVGPEHSWLKDSGRATYVPATDAEALNAFQLCTKLEGIIPALEPAHALAHVIKLAPTMRQDQIIVMNMCGRGDKDVFTVGKILGFEL